MEPKSEKIPVSRPALVGNELKYVTEAVTSGWISSRGKFIDEFEQAFADYCGVDHCMSCSNGTVALHLALLALDIGPGDEVIVPTLTYIASANAVKYVGADVVFADSATDTFNLDVNQIEALITPKTKAIIVVHLYGVAANMPVLMQIAEKHGIYVVEDATEAHGARIGGKRVGSIGHLSTFSFFGNKIITSGEGGVVLTNDESLAKKIRSLKSQGQSEEKRFWHDVVGYNYRMTNVQAAIGLAQIEDLDWHISERRKIGEMYDRLLLSSSNAEPVVQLNYEADVCWLYTVRIKKNTTNVDIQKIVQLLSDHNIEARPFFYPLNTMEIHLQSGNFENADDFSDTCLCLPTWVGIDEKQQRRVVAVLESILSDLQ